MVICLYPSFVNLLYILIILIMKMHLTQIHSKMSLFANIVKFYATGITILPPDVIELYFD